MRENDEYEKMKQTLKTMPKISDSRSREEIYINIKAQEKADKKNTGLFTFKRVFPIIATFILLLSFSPFLFKQVNNTSVKDDRNLEIAQGEMDMAANKEEAKSHIRTPISKRITIGALNMDEETVFVSLDLPIDTENPIEQIKIAEMLISEDEQFISLEPIFNTLQYDNNETFATLKINEENYEHYEKYKGNLKQIMDVTLREFNIQQIIVENEMENKKVDVVNLNREKKPQGPIYFYQLKTGHNLLIQEGENVATIDETIQLMKYSSNEAYDEIIQTNEEIVMTEQDDGLIVKFKESLDLTDQHMYFIESFLQLADSFNYHYIQFENINQEYWQGYALNEPINIIDYFK